MTEIRYFPKNKYLKIVSKGFRIIITSMSDVTDASFQQQVLQAKNPVVVDFWAPWCGPCKIISPIVEELGEEYKGKVDVLKMNVDDNPQVSSQYGIMSIPTLIVFKNGQPVKSTIGAQPKENIKRMIDESLSV
jgi:thioredoxin 1